MQTSFWVKLKGKKSYGTWSVSAPSASVSKPTIEPRSVAVKITLAIPDSYFEQPELLASIKLPDIAEQRSVVETEMLQRAADQLAKELGVTVHFDVIDDEARKVQR